MWRDPWCCGELLANNEESQWNLLLSLDAKISSLISDQGWDEFVLDMQDCSVKDKILNITINRNLDRDATVWKSSLSRESGMKPT